jgi:acylphosphatase
MTLKTAKLKIYGHVQGVFYRHSTKEKARELGIRGYVKNLGDGTVEVVACGREADLDQLIKFCKNNPGSSQVEKVDIKLVSGVIKKCSGFEIK